MAAPANSTWIGYFGASQIIYDGSTTIFTGNVQVTGQFIGPAADNTAAPPFSFLGDLNTGVGSAAADTLNLITGGTSRVALTTTTLTSSVPINFPNGVNAEYGSIYFGGNTFNIETVVNGGTARNLTFGRAGTTYINLTAQGTSILNAGLGVNQTPGAAGNVNATTYSVAGVAGASFNGAVTNITVVNGIVTAAS